MIAHFNFGCSDTSLYFAISSIRQQADGLMVCGTVGDSSAENCFEALVAERVSVQVLEIWDADYDALCRRYEREELERELAACIGELSFRSEGVYDRVSGNWQQRIVAEAAEESPDFAVAEPYRVRPHQQVCESSVFWQRQAS